MKVVEKLLKRDSLINLLVHKYHMASSQLNANPNLQTNPTGSNADNRLVRKSSSVVLHLQRKIDKLDADIRRVDSTNYFDAMNLMEQKMGLESVLRRLQPVQTPMPGAPKAAITFAPLAEPLREQAPESGNLANHAEEVGYEDFQAALFSIREIRQEISNSFLPFFSDMSIQAQAQSLLAIQRAIDMGVPQDLVVELIDEGIIFSHCSGYYNWMQLEKIDKPMLLTYSEMEELVRAAGANTNYSSLKFGYEGLCSQYLSIAACTRGLLNDAGINDPFAKYFSEIAARLIKDEGADASGFFGSDGKFLPWKLGKFLSDKKQCIVSEYLKLYKMQDYMCSRLTADSISALLRTKPRETAAAQSQGQPATPQTPAAQKTHAKPKEKPAEKKKAGAGLVSLSGVKNAIEHAGISLEAVQILLSIGFRWGKVFFRDSNQNATDHILSNAARKYSGQRKDLKDALDFLRSKGLVLVCGKTAALNTKDRGIVAAEFIPLFEEVQRFVDLQLKH